MNKDRAGLTVGNGNKRLNSVGLGGDSLSHQIAQNLEADVQLTIAVASENITTLEEFERKKKEIKKGEEPVSETIVRTLPKEAFNGSFPENIRNAVDGLRYNDLVSQSTTSTLNSLHQLVTGDNAAAMDAAKVLKATFQHTMELEMGSYNGNLGYNTLKNDGKPPWER